ncbi:hypothetical protein CGJ97_24410, partial [Vibrio parahaemolyticus]|uniref:hypothetical protein n=1 Tax=Vibrio parahaemolyticus TaxID=670 RepID=UPI00116B6BCC
CVTRNLIKKRSDENIESYNNKSYKYKKNINGEIKEVSLSSYNRRYPKYIIDIDDIFLFYNRNALIACEAIQSMTGMRKSESLSIKFDSIIDDNDWIGIKSTH